MNISYLTVSVDQGSGGSLAGQFWLRSLMRLQQDAGRSSAVTWSLDWADGLLPKQLTYVAGRRYLVEHLSPSSRQPLHWDA